MGDIRTKRRRRPVASLVTLAVLAFIGIAAAGDALGWWDIPVLTVIVVSLIATTVGVIISAIVNRSWIGLPLVAFLGVITTGLLITQPDLDGGMGERTLAPATVAAAEQPQQLGVGQLTIDLDQVPLTDEPIDVRAEVGIGHLHVIVPRDATVVIDAEVGAGDVTVDGITVDDGVRSSSHERTFEPAGVSAGTITLDLELGIGRIEVDRAL
jgi:hypothetical protein